MAKDNLFLGMARGSVGDVVFSRLDGVQVARSRNRSPRNPRTPLQLIQRIVMSTAGKAYTFFAPLADHSYEGMTGLQASQRAFIRENVDLLRNQIADVIAYPTDRRCEESEVLNYSFVGDVGPVFNPYVISKGSLPSLSIRTKTDGGGATVHSLGVMTSLDAVPADLSDFSYQDMCDAIGVLPGDQLTSVACYIEQDGYSDVFVSLQYARIILMPGSGDLSVPFLTAAGVINDPNERNIGTFRTSAPNLVLDSTLNKVYLSLEMPDFAGLSKVAGCIILSRQDSGGMWLRSTERLLRITDNPDYMTDHTFGWAYISHKRVTSSSLYLNQAENF